MPDMNANTFSHWPRTAAALAIAAALSGCMSSGNKKARCPVPDGTRCMSLAETYARTETSSVPAPDLIDVSTRAGRKQARAERKKAKREGRKQEVTASSIPPPAVKPATSEPAVQRPTHYAHGHWHWIPSDDATAGDAASDTGTPGDSAAADTAARVLPEMQHQTIATYPVTPAPSPAEPVRVPAQVMRIVVTAWEDDTGSLHMPSTIFTEIEPRRWKVGHPATQTSAGFRLFEGLGNQAATPDTAQRPTL